jgi:hypothetical protein
LSRGVHGSLQMMLEAGAKEVDLPSSEEILSGVGPGRLAAITNEKEAAEAASRLYTMAKMTADRFMRRELECRSKSGSK